MSDHFIIPIFSLSTLNKCLNINRIMFAERTIMYVVRKNILYRKGLYNRIIYRIIYMDYITLASKPASVTYHGDR